MYNEKILAIRNNRSTYTADQPAFCNGSFRVKTLLIEIRDMATFTVSVVACAFLFVFSIQAVHQGTFWIALPAVMFIFAVYFIGKLVLTGSPPKLITDDAFISEHKEAKVPFWKAHGWKFWLIATMICAAFVVSKLIALVDFLAQRF